RRRARPRCGPGVGGAVPRDAAAAADAARHHVLLMDVARVVGRARQVVSVLASPTLRAAVLGGSPVDGRTRAAIDSFDWLTDEGPDASVLGRTARELQRLQSPAAVLDFDRI